MAKVIRTIPEPNKSVNVVSECDVVVVGGGPGGIGAAVAAARNGAKTVLVERYGHLGGMGTGGLVTIIPCLSDFSGVMQIGGINQEWIERLKPREAATHPPRMWGSNDKRPSHIGTIVPSSPSARAHGLCRPHRRRNFQMYPE